MNDSTRIILQILIGSTFIAAICGIIVWSTGVNEVCEIVGGVSAVIASITFIAFLIALVVRAGKD